MLLQIDSKQEVKWATVLFTPDIDDILYCSAVTVVTLLRHGSPPGSPPMVFVC